jgi:hypothetical protein
MNYSDAYLALTGQSPKRIPRWEHLSNPDFIQLVTGIDPWDKPRSAALKFSETYKMDWGYGIPADDTPIERPDSKQSSYVGEDGRSRVRWGTDFSGHWEWGNNFHTIEQVLAYEPLKNLDMREMEIIEKRDYSLDDETFYKTYFEWGEPQTGDTTEVVMGGFYNTMFMWPLLTFGWELFLELAGGYPEDTARILGDFAQINRKVFKAFARNPNINSIVCHDDICMTAGPVCSPTWLRKYVYPYYEEFWGILKAAGKRVIFMSDGNIDKVADDIAACGAEGFVSEPYTDWKTIAHKYPNYLQAGEGDNRILMSNNKQAISKMVDDMLETSKICGGYVMCVGNHIPWNIPAEAVKYYFDLVDERAHR